jgi:hypothetical protein
MTSRNRTCWSLLIASLSFSHAYALLNMNEGKDLVFVSGTYSIGLDTNVFTRAAATQSMTQNASASVSYTRQAGLIGVTASLSAASGRFESIRGQDFTDPSLSLSLRKRYGRTTGSLALSLSRDSQPDPDAGQRTRALNYSGNLDLRYPVNDRYYITNAVRTGSKFYTNQLAFSDLQTYSDAIAINYIYTSKLDLNGGYTITVSDTSKNTKAYDQSFTVGSSGSLLAKLSGSVHIGVQRRDSESTVGGHETFDAFTSATSLKWLYSRKLSFNADLGKDFSVTSTDISVNRATAGLHAAFSFSSKYLGNTGVSYTVSDFLGAAGDGRKDKMFQFDASIGLALTTHVRTSLAYAYTYNESTSSGATFERQTLTFTVIATY